MRATPCFHAIAAAAADIAYADAVHARHIIAPLSRAAMLFDAAYAAADDVARSQFSLRCFSHTDASRC